MVLFFFLITSESTNFLSEYTGSDMAFGYILGISLAYKHTISISLQGIWLFWLKSSYEDHKQNTSVPVQLELVKNLTLNMNVR